MNRLKQRGKKQASEPELQPENGSHRISEALNDQILIEEVMAQMDSWTRKVFELRVLGHQFEDIAQMYKTSPKLLRSKFHKEIKKLSHRLRG